ncbi:Hint domain-containing protein [uncultured Roseobacter sp.]|uniref:Hint domain-containing protein n=1 Tax=uncultured Roseobacter sp. TaxID=114847 RepID=UPI00260F5537|nr:Hint domain-containing protein [uncultured Roseobacter sp.]
MKSGVRGTFVISWAQTEVDGLMPAPVEALGTGVSWSWQGDAVQVDGPSGVLRLDAAEGAEDLRRRAARAVQRLVGTVTGQKGDTGRQDDDRQNTHAQSSFVITDGLASYTVTLISTGAGTPPLLMFLDELPPRNTEMWVVHCNARTTAGHEPESGRVICFTPGTRISTPRGQVPVEALRPGDLVQTRDNGAQPVRWLGRRHMSGARLFAMPALRPVRFRTGALGIEIPDQELLVSPAHRMLIRGAVARDLFNTDEVLVAARDLINGDRIVRDTGARQVTYFHLLLPTHNVLWANGVATESFHPADTGPDLLDSGDRARLTSVIPEAVSDPWRYGVHARRCLTAAEAALMIRAA